jgi:chemotaxis protein CheY-P-specific phosphatase CheC
VVPEISAGTYSLSFSLGNDETFSCDIEIIKEGFTELSTKMASLLNDPCVNMTVPRIKLSQI